MAASAHGDDDDAFIRTRLLTQTTTARPGADPPVKRLVKRLVDLCASLAKRPGSSEDGDAAAARAPQRREAVLRELALFEFQLARVAAIDAACASETAAHAALRADVDAEVAEARREIAVLRSALEDARLDRRRNEEYETLRRACAKLPKRDATLAACERLEREIAEMEAEEEKAARRFDERRARVDALVDAVDALEEDVVDDGRAEEEPIGIAADRNVGAVAMETD